MVARAEAAAWRPRWRLWGLLGGGSAIFVLLSALAGWRAHHLLLINRTDSLPTWALFVRTDATPERGDYVAFLPPAHPLVLRHFGGKPEAWSKIVYGIPGDLVAHRGAWVTVNGRAVGHLKPRTRFGEDLTPGPTGRIPTGCYFVGTPHPDGFDSRYAEIGFVCRSQLLGVGQAVL